MEKIDLYRKLTLNSSRGLSFRASAPPRCSILVKLIFTFYPSTIYHLLTTPLHSFASSLFSGNFTSTPLHAGHTLGLVII